ncbi:MAG: flagellar assembly protein T N-terminal domain-containing protein [Pseudomonadota bacterium]
MRFVLAFILSLALGPLSAAAESTARWIEAEGLAFIQSQSDSDAARQRALGEALISAALGGGAQLDGHSTLHNTRLVSDIAVLRATGQVFRHELLSARVDQGHWRVRVRALVGPAQPLGCSGSRLLTVDAVPPQISVSPQAGAWAVPVAQRLSRDLLASIGELPWVSIESIRSKPTRRVAAGLDYTSLTRGERVTPPGNQTLELALDLRGQGLRTELTLAVTVLDRGGKSIRRIFRRQASARSDGLDALITGQHRPRAEAQLAAGLVQDVRAFFATLACQAPRARIAGRGDTLSVPLGRRHGLTKTSLAFVDDGAASIGLLEIVTLGERTATLKPLDPRASAGSFAGREIYFVGTAR